MSKDVFYDKKRRKKRKSKLTILLVCVVFILGGIITGQVILNRNKASEDSKVALAKAQEEEKKNKSDSESNKLDSNKDNDEKASVSEENKDKLSNEDKSKTGLSAADAQKAVEGKLDKNGKKVAFLTFDDGPSTTVTPKVLDTLKKYDVKATFFIVGSQLENGGEKAQALLKREYEEEHTIANHTYSHDYKYLYPNRSINVDRFLGEVEKTDNAISKALGQDFKTSVVRFPGGLMSWKNQGAAKEALSKKKIQYVDWNALSGDAEGKKRSADQLFERTKKEVGQQEKVVILMHDTYGKETTAESLPKVIEYLKSQGYEFETLK